MHPSFSVRPRLNGKMKLRSDRGEVRVSPHLNEPDGLTMGLLRLGAEQEQR